MTEHNPRIAYVLLAAGASRRFGRCKQLANINFKNETLLEHSLTTCLDLAPGELFLVLGAHQEKIEAHIDFAKQYPRVHTIYNSRWAEGVATSITSALEEIMLGEDYDGVMIMLADQVAITADQLKDMREHWFKTSDLIVAAEYSEIVGAPAIFPKRFFGELLQLSGDQGARHLLRAYSDDVLPFTLDEAQWDIDTERNLDDWQMELI